MNFAAERLCAGNGAALGRLLGVPKNTVWEWRAGLARPQLTLLLRLALLLNVSLRHLLLSPMPLELEMAAHLRLGERLVGCTSPENGRRAATRTWESVQQALSHEVAMGPRAPGGTIAMRKVATGLGVPVRTLYRRFPELARAVAATHRADRRLRRQARLQRRCREVAGTVRLLRTRSRQVTSRQFRQVYVKAGYLRDPVVRMAFFQAAHRQA